MGFLQRLAEDQARRFSPNALSPLIAKDEVNGKATGQTMPDPYKGPQPPGRFSPGTQLQGGPSYSDAFRSRPSPSLTQLIENYSALLYAMVACNRDAVSRLPMRLMADGSRVQGGKPNRACDPIRVSRAVGKKLAESGQISTGAVDQVYEVRNHPLLDVIDNPDPYGNFTKEQFIGLICSYMDVVGSAYLVPEGNGWDWKNPDVRIKGPPEYLWVIYPQYTIPIRLSASPIVNHFMYFADWIPRSSTIWFRHNHSLRDAYGSAFSPANASEPYRKQEQEQVAILSQVLGIGPRPNMIASAKDPLMPPGEKERQSLMEDLKRQHAAGMAGGVLVNTGAFDWTPVSYSPADIAGKDISEYDIYNMAAIFGQPATYYTVDSNLANLQAADAQHARKGVEPRCKTIAGVFTRLARSFDQRLFFQFDPALPEDDLARAQVDKIYFDMGARTANQINQDLKYPAEEWGEEPLLNKNLQTWTMLKESHEQGLEAQRQTLENQKKATDFQYSDDAAEEKPAATESEPTETERSLWMQLDAVNRKIQTEVIRAKGGNPHHVPSGPHGGEFAPTGGGGAGTTAQPAHGKHWAKRQKKKANKPRKPTNKLVAGGGGGEGHAETAKPKPKPKRQRMTAKEKRDRLAKGKPLTGLSEKAKRAQKNQNKTTGEVQTYTKNNEHEFAKRIGGKSYPDNDPQDIDVTVNGKTRPVELKTVTHGKNDKITMKGSALERKVQLEKEMDSQMDTVILDHRDRFAGGKNKALYSGNEIYYKRGIGSFRMGTMHPVKNEAELIKLMATPYDKLPKAAQGPIRGTKT